MGSTVDRVVRLLTVVLFLFMTISCTSTRMAPIGKEVDREGSNLRETTGLWIVGYTTAAGHYHGYDGHVTLAGADSLLFLPRPGSLYDDHGFERKMAIADVQELHVKYTSAGKSLLLVTVLVGVVVLVIAAAASGSDSTPSSSNTGTSESCPFLYSYDGGQFVFDGEPYGGATMSSLQRTDYAELEHLAEEDGRYRLLLTNEVDETQHTDSIHLLVADHSAATSAVMDFDGDVHCFRQTSPLIAAQDEQGRDLTTWLRETDRVAWNPNLIAYAAQDSLTDTRNHITLEFARPPGVDHVYLVSNVSTGQWGSQMIRVMLGMRGNEVQDFYDAVNGNAGYQQALAAWNRREGLFVLPLESQEEGRWERRGELHGGGPLVTESRAIPLDISGVTGDTVRLRIHPPIGFWRLESFHLAWDDAPPVTSRLEIATARDENGVDVRPLLKATDGATFDQPTHEQRVEVVFDAPPVLAGSRRSIFAVTTGWYELHLHSDGPPDSVGIRRLAEEPGYAVRRGIQEFAERWNSRALAYGDAVGP